MIIHSYKSNYTLAKENKSMSECWNSVAFPFHSQLIVNDIRVEVTTQIIEHNIQYAVYLLKLGGAESVVKLLCALRQGLSRGEEGHQPLLYLSVGQDRSHDLWRQYAGQVHCRQKKHRCWHSRRTAQAQRCYSV